MNPKSIENGEFQFAAAGHGKGHGVGLCQWGAIGMALSGKTFREIIEHYYPGTEVSSESPAWSRRDFHKL